MAGHDGSSRPVGGARVARPSPGYVGGMTALRLRLPALLVAALLAAAAPGCSTDDAAKKDAKNAAQDADKAAGKADEKAKNEADKAKKDAEQAAEDVDGN